MGLNVIKLSFVDLHGWFLHIQPMVISPFPQGFCYVHDDRKSSWLLGRSYPVYHVAWPTWPWPEQGWTGIWPPKNVWFCTSASTIKWWGNPHPSSQNWNTSGRLERVHPPYMFCLLQVCPELKAMNDGELCADSNRWFLVEAVPLWWRVICLIAIQVFESTWFTDALFKASGLYGHNMT